MNWWAISIALALLIVVILVAGYLLSPRRGKDGDDD
jgi:hypothetical protein